MAEPSLKIVTESSSAANSKPGSRFSRKRVRLILLIMLPLLALAGGTVLYLGSGRYITTDNAYVGAQKVLITPDISGKIANVEVHEGQHVKAGDVLFEIDPQPFQIALDQAKAKLASVKTDFTNLKSDYQIYSQLADVAKQNTDLKKTDVERKKALAASHAGSQLDYETAESAQLTALLQTQLAVQRRDQSFNQLLGDANLPIERFPAYQQAKAAVEQAQRDLDHTVLHAPISGMATQVDNIQLGRFVTAGTPMFSVIDDAAPWIDANPKETDITHLKVGQPVNVWVDTFPDTTFTGAVESVSPGTGAQFSILPPQNASGNWVKVVQRVPVRIHLDKNPALTGLRAGMSAYVEIDTGKQPGLFSGGQKQAALK